MMDYEQFYPTPKPLIDELLSIGPVNMDYVTTVLEPSAGTGIIAEAVNGYRNYSAYSRRKAIYCIELNEERRNILKGKEFPIIWDDFLTFDSMMQFSLIAMNPPFADGELHLLKAIDLCEPGGQIACILNAETIKNPYTKTRQKLAQLLEQQEKVNIKYKTGAFLEADRKAEVEIALIYIKKKDRENKCRTLEGYQKSIIEENKVKEQSTLTRHGEVNQLVDYYKAEVMAALKLYDEITSFERLALQPNKETYMNVELFQIKINKRTGRDAPERTPRFDIVKTLNYKYWQILLYSKELAALLTSDLQSQYQNKLSEMANFEFNDRNIAQLKQDLFKELAFGIDDAIMKVWDNFTSRFSYSEYSKNIHFYDGWVTNKAFGCNKKVIIPLYAFNSWNKDQLEVYSVTSKLSDIEKAMNYLDCGRTECFNLANILKKVQETGQTGNIDTKFFTVTFYKKGTCHLVFKDMELLKKFNLFAGRKLNFLPGDYGKKAYEDLTKREKEIVNSFEGKESYQDTYSHQEFYLPATQNILSIEATK